MFFKLFGAMIAIAAGVMLYFFPVKIALANYYHLSTGLVMVSLAILALILIYSAATVRRKKRQIRRLVKTASSLGDFFAFYKKDDLYKTTYCFHGRDKKNFGGALLDEIGGPKLFRKYEFFPVKFSFNLHVKIPIIEFNVMVAVENFIVVFDNCGSEEAIKKLPIRYNSEQAARNSIEKVLKKALEAAAREVLTARELGVNKIEGDLQDICEDFRQDVGGIFPDKANQLLAEDTAKELYFYRGDEFRLAVDFLPTLSRTDNKIVKE
jgi:hypothetical protein